MKKLLLASTMLAAFAAVGPAGAADLPRGPVYKAPVAAPVYYNWTGCYIGVQGGGAWGRSRHDTIVGPTTANDIDLSGGLIGGTVGCNYQTGTWLFGVEGDFSWTNKRGSEAFSLAFPGFSSETREHWLGTIRGRIGFLPSPQWLIYATGGGAVADIEATVSSPIGSVSETQTRWGWTVGAGTEWQFLPNWSAKIEYLYVQFEDASYFNIPTFGPALTNVPVNNHIVRAGINYKFDWGGPVYAKY